MNYINLHPVQPNLIKQLTNEQKMGIRKKILIFPLLKEIRWERCEFCESHPFLLLNSAEQKLNPKRYQTQVI